jgi:hypothetical protein
VGATAELRSLVENTGVLHLSSSACVSRTDAFTSTLSVPRTMPVDSVVKLKDTLTEKSSKFQADVTVTVNPVTLDDETVFNGALIASRRNLAIHHLTSRKSKAGWR